MYVVTGGASGAVDGEGCGSERAALAHPAHHRFLCFHRPPHTHSAAPSAGRTPVNPSELPDLMGKWQYQYMGAILVQCYTADATQACSATEQDCCVSTLATGLLQPLPGNPL